MIPPNFRRQNICPTCKHFQLDWGTVIMTCAKYAERINEISVCDDYEKVEKKLDELKSKKEEEE